MVKASIFLKDPIDVINKRDYVSLKITFYFELVSFIFVYKLPFKENLSDSLKMMFFYFVEIFCILGIFW